MMKLNNNIILGVFQAVFNQEVKEIRNILNQIIQ